jgi:hypothetical protein
MEITSIGKKKLIANHKYIITLDGTNQTYIRRLIGDDCFYW